MQLLEDVRVMLVFMMHFSLVVTHVKKLVKPVLEEIKVVVLHVNLLTSVK
jgi:hypothetical protein